MDANGSGCKITLKKTYLSQIRKIMSQIRKK